MSPEFSLFPEQASTIASKVDALYVFALAISAFFSLLIALVIFFFFIRFRRREAGEVGHQSHGSMVLEVVWSIVPLVITMVLFVWGAVIFIEMRTMPPDATEYFATAKQWMWKFQHPEGQREINHLHIPVNEKIKLTMTSEDVIHSFFVPAFRVKQDVLPGRYTTIWFEADKPGKYHLFCTEYCGSHHSQMIGSVTVMEADDYQAWLAGGAATAAAPKDLGEQLFEQYICNTCHYEDDSGRGPSLVGIYGKEAKFTDGTTRVRDDDYLRESIMMPAASVVEGYLQIMPTYQGQLSEVSLLQLISYIKSLGGSAGEEAAPPVVADASAGATADNTGESPNE